MKVIGLKCLKCETEFSEQNMFEGCPVCKTENFRSNVIPIYDYNTIRKIVSREYLMSKRSGLWGFRDLLPIEKEENIISLEEGSTPLIKCQKLGKTWGLNNLYVKDESRNPTGSFKDRLATVAISKAKELGAKVTTVASTGNHGISTAAYSSRGGLLSVIFTTETVPSVLKNMMQVYGGFTVATHSPSERWIIMKKCIEKYKWFPTGNYVFPAVVGSNFYGNEGYKTIAYEICIDLGWKVPDKVFMPVAFADGLSGTWRGFKDFYQLGLITSLPRMFSAELFGSLKNSLENDLEILEEVKIKPSIAQTLVTGMGTYQGLWTLRDSGGGSILVDDHEMERMQLLLGSHGIYAEPASLASLVAVKKASLEGKVHPDEIIVAVLTSTGLKDPEVTSRIVPNVPVIEPNLKDLIQTLKASYNFDPVKNDF
jgi:threonine synthase